MEIHYECRSSEPPLYMGIPVSSYVCVWNVSGEKSKKRVLAEKYRTSCSSRGIIYLRISMVESITYALYGMLFILLADRKPGCWNTDCESGI